jgi:hypothetical protein
VVGVRAGGVAVLLVAEHVREVLLDAAAVYDVQDLHPAADAERGYAALDGAARQSELVGVALVLDRTRLGMALLAVEGRVHVPRPAGEDQGVHEIQHPVRVLGVLGVGEEQDGPSAGSLDGLHVACRTDEGRDLVPGAVAHVLGGRRYSYGGPGEATHRRSKDR